MLRKHPGHEAQLTEEESDAHRELDRVRDSINLKKKKKEKFTTHKIAQVWFEFLGLFHTFFT